jgi:hypothetical protein
VTDPDVTISYPTYAADLIIQGPQGPPGLSGGNAVYNYLYAGGTASVDPGVGGIAIQSIGGQSRRIAISKTDADGTPRRPEMLLTGDTVTVTDSPATPPVTGWARYVLTNDPVDNGAFVVFDALRTDTTGTQTPPPIGTALRVYGSMSGGGPVTTGMIVDGAVTTPKIADAAITDNKIGGSLAPIISNPATGRLAIGGIELGDTGWRQMPVFNGWAATHVRIRRVGGYVAIAWFGLTGVNSTAPEIINLPDGFRAPRMRRFNVDGSGAVAGLIVYTDNTGTFASTVYQTMTSGRSEIGYLTDDAWPNVLPGIPAAVADEPEPR